MKSIAKIAVCIAVFISSFGLQSCKKDTIEIAPVNKSIIGKWKSINGTGTTEREFRKGIDDLHGTGNIKITTTNTGNELVVITAPFNWDISGNVLHIENIADVEFVFQITEDGNRLILFDFIHRNQVSATFERIN